MNDFYKKYMPTESERQEYLAYKSPEDVLHNFNEGVMLLESELSGRYIDSPVLICGGMAAFDKGLIDFINRLLELNSNLFLLSEVTVYMYPSSSCKGDYCSWNGYSGKSGGFGFIGTKAVCKRGG